MFSLGCAGNIVPIEREGDARRWIGTALGAEVLKVTEGIETDSDVKLGVKSNSVKLPLKPLPSPDELRREIEATERAIAEAERKGAPYPEISALKGKLQKAKHTLLLAEETGGEREVETEIKAVRVGTLKLACLPGEVFVEIGLSIKEKYKDAFVISLCNDSLNYVPISSAYDEGGYEPETTILDRGAGEMLLSEILKLLEEV